MPNSILSENTGKKGSYTIRVRKGYAIPKKSIREIASNLLKPIKRPTICNIEKSKE